MRTYGRAKAPVPLAAQAPSAAEKTLPKAEKTLPKTELALPKVEKTLGGPRSVYRQTALALPNMACATECASCGMAYDPAVPADAAAHRAEHARRDAVFSGAQYVRAATWRRLLPSGAAVYCVAALRCAALVARVSEEMDAAPVAPMSECDVLVFCDRASTVSGVLVVRFRPEGDCSREACIEGASTDRVQSKDAPFEKAFQAGVCVERIWVHPGARRTGVARTLVDALRSCSHADAAQCTDACAVPRASLVFSQLTTAGRLFFSALGCLNLPPAM